MAYNLTANLVNVIFNYALIHGNLGFLNGVAGASIATVIGQRSLCIGFDSCPQGESVFTSTFHRWIQTT